MRKRSDPPTKVCAACGRLFVWRKKWEGVRYCSERRRRNRKSDARS
ncbi:MAG TPA: DUF2256 domain-containing protein [Acetobacteraceae bacterium]|nr:DUF2256 domain-containing protein [Acetobacteraceae bacterium]